MIDRGGRLPPRAVAEVVFKNTDFLPILRPNLYSSTRVACFFRREKETARDQVLVYSFEQESLDVKIDVKLPFGDYNRVCAVSAEGALILFTGRHIGLVLKNHGVTNQLQF